MNGRVSVIDGRVALHILVWYTAVFHIQVCYRFFISSLCLRHFKQTEDQFLCVVCLPQFFLRNSELAQK